MTQDTNRLLQIVSEPTRQRILLATWDQERNAGEIAKSFPTTFGAVSQHLRVLRDAGAVRVERRGKYRFYRAERERLGPVRDFLEAFWRHQLAELSTMAEAEDEEQ
jgi:DNA-binding transcriptional ArsR family regulator